MATLKTDPNFARPDDVYARLLELHRDLSEEESIRVNARLVLLLANHIGDMEILEQAMRAALPAKNG